MSKLTMYDASWVTLWNSKTNKVSVVLTADEADALHKQIKQELAEAGISK